VHRWSAPSERTRRVGANRNPDIRTADLFERIGRARVARRYGDSLELEVELPFDTGAPAEAVCAAAGGEVQVRRPP
jgi:hypothetical protein